MAAPANSPAAAKEAPAEPEDESAALPAAGREPGLASQSANFLEKHWSTVWPLPERPCALQYVQAGLELPEALPELPEPEPEPLEAEPEPAELPEVPEPDWDLPERLFLPEEADAAFARASRVPAASRTPSGPFSRP